jgi:hypothetical protein
MPVTVAKVRLGTRHVLRQPLACWHGTRRSLRPCHTCTGTRIDSSSNPHDEMSATPSSHHPYSPGARPSRIQRTM